MTEAVATIEGKTLDSRYTLLDKLGAGGQGEVWRAHDGTRGVDIALKVVNPPPGREGAAWEALQHEYDIASKLDHPSILKVFPPERSGDLMVLPMELASGGDIRRLRGAGFLEIIPVLLETAQALEHAHERGVVHRDLKPGNVLFDARGRARLADFGVAEQAMTAAEANSSGLSAPATRDTNRHGFSPFTASPAQLRGEPPTPADDIYGLGALAYELLSGYPPYYPHFDKNRAIEERVPTLVPTRQIPPLLGKLVMNLLAKDAKRRPRTMREVIDELDAAINDTLTYDFENVSPATPTASVAMQARAAQSNSWTPEAGDRRGSADRRGRRREDLEAGETDGDLGGRRGAIANEASAGQEGAGARDAGGAREARGASEVAGAGEVAGAREAPGGREARVAVPSRAPRLREPTILSPRRNADAVDSNTANSNIASSHAADSRAADAGAHDSNTQHSKPRSGADVLARIDAALERTSGDTGSRPKLGSSAAPLTPETAAALVAAARAAGSQPVSRQPAPHVAKSGRQGTASGAQAAPTGAQAATRGAQGAAPLRQHDSGGSLHRHDADPSRQHDAGPLHRPDAGYSALSTSTIIRAPAPASTTTHLLPPDAPAKLVPASELPQAPPPVTQAPPPPAAHAPPRFWPAKAPEDPNQQDAGAAGATTRGHGDASARGHGDAGARGHAQRNEAVAPGHRPASPPPVAPAARMSPTARGAHVHVSGAQASGVLYPDPMRIETGPMHATWDIPLDGLPKVARLEPIKPRRWPFVFLGVLAGAAAAVYFWLPRFDTDTLPPEVASVVAPLKAALTQSSESQATTAEGAGAEATGAAAGESAPTDGGAGSSAAPATRLATGAGASGSRAAGPGGSQAAGAGGSQAVAAGGSQVEGTGGAQAMGAGAQTARSAGTTTSASNTSASSAADEQRLREMRQAFDTRVGALEARGAGVWGGREFAIAKTRAAESVGAHDAGNARVAQERLTAAMKLLDTVESKAPQALSAQVAAGEKALGAGQQEVAGQAFDLARRINPTDRRVSDGQRRAQNLNAVLPLLADAQNAEAAHDYARAAQDYSQALALDPGNATARAGQARANAAFGDDNYAKAVGSGFAALGAGRLDEAQEAFVKARALKPNGAEASEGLRRVSAALSARGFASMRNRALGLEAQERWEEAERVYEDVLAADPSLAFAQEGKARTTSRADLSLRLQQYLDRPDRLSTPSVREDARALLETARAQSPQGQVIRSQIARLDILLPGFDKPVRLSLVSDNSTQIVIPSIGSFGTFARRDIELRPGKYTVVGTRNGFRDVRREITIAPGQEIQTIRVTCSDPI